MKTLERLNNIQDTVNLDEWHKYNIKLHKERYLYASKYVRGKMVLDLACGIGYGSRILKENGANHVLGIDVSEDAIKEASSIYEIDGIKFIKSDYRDLNLYHNKEQQFDIVVSLETIEHLDYPEDFIEKMYGIINKGGMYICSVPITPSVDINIYHKHDFTKKSIFLLLKKKGYFIKEYFIQKHKYNPFLIKNVLKRNNRSDYRKNLIGYYFSHPGKLFSRIFTTLRYGFCNYYIVIVCVKE